MFFGKKIPVWDITVFFWGEQSARLFGWRYNPDKNEISVMILAQRWADIQHNTSEVALFSVRARSKHALVLPGWILIFHILLQAFEDRCLCGLQASPVIVRSNGCENEHFLRFNFPHNCWKETKLCVVNSGASSYCVKRDCRRVLRRILQQNDHTFTSLNVGWDEPPSVSADAEP